MKTNIYEFTSQICPSENDIDHNDHVNNVSYLKWTQQVSIAHWEARCPPDSNLEIKWVIIRHEIDYKTPAFLNESIIAKNWWGGASRLRFEQFTEFFLIRDHRLLAKVYSLLCPVHIITGRPFVIDEEMRTRLGIKPGLQSSYRHRQLESNPIPAYSD
jgi:acyl-CoA thioester hydrolase